MVGSAVRPPPDQPGTRMSVTLRRLGPADAAALDAFLARLE